MDLIDKTSRDNYGLNSWERAIVWSAMSLRASNVRYNHDNPELNYRHTNAVRITLTRAIIDEALTATLRIEATLPYVKSFGLASGGNFIKWLHPFYNGESENITSDSCSVLDGNGIITTGGGEGLPTKPDYVITLEQYFLWVCWETEASLLSPLPSQLLPLTIDFFEESTPDPTIKVVANIPIDYAAYKENNNLICSVRSLKSSISPAGLRGITWEDVTGKPDFANVATSGRYSDLTNAPNVPSSLDQLSRFSELVRSINGNYPDPVSGAVNLGLDVGSVDWSGVSNKPDFADVAFTGNYSDLTGVPTIPILSWGNVVGKPTFADVAFSGNYSDLEGAPTALSSDWSDITNKPIFAAVTFSGSYNDLTDKPNISSEGGVQAILGKKALIAPSSHNIPYSFDGDFTGIVNWLGTSANTTAYTNPFDVKIHITNDGNTYNKRERIFNQSIASESYSSRKWYFQTNYSPIFTYTNYDIKLSKASFYGWQKAYQITVEGSTDEINWDFITTQTGEITETTGWTLINIDSPSFYKHYRFTYVGDGNWQINEMEFYGEIQSNNVADASLSAFLDLSHINYLLEPHITVGTIYLLPLSTPGLNVGDRFYAFNPHPTTIQAVPSGSDQLVSSNGLSTLSQGQTAELVKVSELQWFAF